MNRTKSFIIFASVTLIFYVVFNTLAATNVFAIASDEYNNYHSENSSENYYDKSEKSHNSYDGYYDDFENGYYEDRYGKLYYIE